MWHVGSNVNVHLWPSTVEIIRNISMLVLTKTRKSKDLRDHLFGTYAKFYGKPTLLTL